MHVTAIPFLKIIYYIRSEHSGLKFLTSIAYLKSQPVSSPSQFLFPALLFFHYIDHFLKYVVFFYLLWVWLILPICLLICKLHEGQFHVITTVLGSAESMMSIGCLLCLKHWAKLVKPSRCICSISLSFIIAQQQDTNNESTPGLLDFQMKEDL